MIACGKHSSRGARTPDDRRRLWQLRATSGQMMLEFLGERRAAEMVEAAVRSVLRDGRALTRDLGGSASTRACADAVLAQLQ